MNWKLVTVILISLILLIASYLTLVSTADFQKYFITKKIQVQEPNYNFTIHQKIKIDIPKEEDFKVLKIPENYVGYYFFDKCPEYKQEFFLIDLTEEGLEKYHIPEQGYLIIVKKEHKWTKEPDFAYWKLEN